MKTQMDSSTGGIRLWSRKTIVCLLAAVIGLATWHFKYRDGRPTDSTPGTSSLTRTANRAGLASQPSPAAQHEVAGQPPNVQFANHPEDGPAWSVPYGHEFWRPNAAPPAPPKGNTNPA